SRGLFAPTANPLSVAVDRGAPAVPVGELAAVFLGRAPGFYRGARLRARAVRPGGGFAGSDAFRRLRVERLRHRCRTAMGADAEHDDGPGGVALAEGQGCAGPDFARRLGDL